MGDRHFIEGLSFDEIFSKLLDSLSSSPQYVCSPRGSKIKENLAVTLLLHNPQARLITSEKRATNYGFGVGEFLWYWQGKNDLNTMLYYNKRMKDFSNDGLTLNSAYGYRLRKQQFFTNRDKYGSGGTQWDTAVQTLLQDPESRRCVLLINLPQDEREAVVESSKDVPCTLSLQFFIRDGALDLHSHMRSNDVIWGLTYDLFSFTLFQECMLLCLKEHQQFAELKLGKYYHTAGSMHLYERHFQLAEDIVDEYSEMEYKITQMEPISSLEDLDELCTDESILRRGLDTTFGRYDEIDLMDFSGGLKWMAEQLNLHRKKRDEEK